MDGVCTLAEAGVKSEAIEFAIDGNSAFKSDVPVFPLKGGRFPLKFEAVSPQGSDAVTKELYVVVSRYPRTRCSMLLLHVSWQ